MKSSSRRQRAAHSPVLLGGDIRTLTSLPKSPAPKRAQPSPAKPAKNPAKPSSNSRQRTGVVRVSACQSDNPQYAQRLTVILPVRGEVKKRARVTCNGGYQDERTRRFEADVARSVQAAMARTGVAMFTVPVRIGIAFFFRGDSGLMPTGSADGDLDNLLKAVLDGMNKVAYLDDRLVQRLADSVKLTGPEDMIVIDITTAPPGPPDWVADALSIGVRI